MASCCAMRLRLYAEESGEDLEVMSGSKAGDFMSAAHSKVVFKERQHEDGTGFKACWT